MTRRTPTARRRRRGGRAADDDDRAGAQPALGSARRPVRHQRARRRRRRPSGSTSAALPCRPRRRRGAARPRPAAAGRGRDAGHGRGDHADRRLRRAPDRAASGTRCAPRSQESSSPPAARSPRSTGRSAPSCSARIPTDTAGRLRPGPLRRRQRAPVVPAGPVLRAADRRGQDDPLLADGAARRGRRPRRRRDGAPRRAAAAAAQGRRALRRGRDGAGRRARPRLEPHRSRRAGRGRAAAACSCPSAGRRSPRPAETDARPGRRGLPSETRARTLQATLQRLIASDADLESQDLMTQAPSRPAPTASTTAVPGSGSASPARSAACGSTPAAVPRCSRSRSMTARRCSPPSSSAGARRRPRRRSGGAPARAASCVDGEPVIYNPAYELLAGAAAEQVTRAAPTGSCPKPHLPHELAPAGSGTCVAGSRPTRRRPLGQRPARLRSAAGAASSTASCRRSSSRPATSPPGSPPADRRGAPRRRAHRCAVGPGRAGAAGTIGSRRPRHRVRLGAARAQGDRLLPARHPRHRRHAVAFFGSSWSAGHSSGSSPGSCSRDYVGWRRAAGCGARGSRRPRCGRCSTARRSACGSRSTRPGHATSWRRCGSRSATPCDAGADSGSPC